MQLLENLLVKAELPINKASLILAAFTWVSLTDQSFFHFVAKFFQIPGEIQLC